MPPWSPRRCPRPRPSRTASTTNSAPRCHRPPRRCASSPAPARARPGCSPAASPTARPPATRPPARAGPHLHPQGGGRAAPPAARRSGCATASPPGTFHAVAYAQLRSPLGRPRHPAARRCSTARSASSPGSSRPRPRDGHPGRPRRARSSGPRPAWSSPTTYARAASPTGHAALGGARRRRRGLRRYEEEKRERAHGRLRRPAGACAGATFATTPSSPAAQRWRFRHLFVDEFQDVNPLQLALLRAWLGDRLDLCVVGDPNQAIYAGTAPTPSPCAEFPTRFPGAEVVRLARQLPVDPPDPRRRQRGAGRRRTGAARCLQPPGRRPGARRCASYADDEAEAARASPGRSRDHHGPARRWSRPGRARAHQRPDRRMLEEALRTAGIPFRVAGRGALLEQAGGQGRAGRAAPAQRTSLSSRRSGHLEAEDEAIGTGDPAEPSARANVGRPRAAGPRLPRRRAPRAPVRASRVAHRDPGPIRPDR